ncbi:MAG: hypothetical protein IPO26_21755 [Saprospiraceae bacterium]|nr:hypothetical protein [Saprospiraceae bacterium]
MVFKKPRVNTVASVDTLYMGAQAGLGGWDGLIDEFRIYHDQLDELDLAEIMETTASSQTLGLSHYWKMDEELGKSLISKIDTNCFLRCPF